MNILVAERNEGARLSLAQGLGAEGYNVLQAADEGSVFEVLRRARVALVLLDLEIGHGEDLGLLSRMMATLPEVPVVLLVNGSPEERVKRALACGARECLRKPFTPAEVAVCVRRIVPLEAGNRANGGRALDRTMQVQEAVWSPATRGVYRDLERAAGSDATVLVTGETGSGKEVVARTIHALSGRRERAFVAVNCAALTPTLLESEFFGHEKGAFTSATGQRKGRFELAEGGTLLLDEIGELALELQPKLLRVLQDQTFERVGSSKTLEANVRIIATTNRDLEHAVEAGRFRPDLYYRLNVLVIEIPAIRHRRSEIPLLVDHFLRSHGKRVTREALAKMCEYDWPGNVREIENVIKRMMVMSQGNEIGIDPLPLAIRCCGQRASIASLSLDEALERAEREHIQSTLQGTGWNLSRASSILRIDRKTLRAKMRRHRILPPVSFPAPLVPV
jgi:DNA-binding NtrC family response regulator